MSRNYKFKNPIGGYFVSFAVVEWIDVFTRNETSMNTGVHLTGYAATALGHL